MRLIVCCWCLLVLTVAAKVSASPVVSPWLGAGEPTVQKLADLPPADEPSTDNVDCTLATTLRYPGFGSQDDCLISAPYGQAGSSGVVFDGTNQQIAIDPPAPFFSLLPVPNQALMYTFTSSSYLGVYLHFYQSVRSRLPLLPEYGNAGWHYQLTARPDLTLRGRDGNPLALNAASIAFSANGNWLVADVIGQGLIRVNLATFDVQPFAASLQPPNQFSSPPAQLAISSDGATAVVYAPDSNRFKLYAINGCQAGVSLPLASDALPCPERDLLPAVTAILPGLRYIYQPRLAGPGTLSFIAKYDDHGTLKSGRFAMAAPGIALTGTGYLAVGDSYASGEGTFSYQWPTDSHSNRCHTSQAAYGAILSRQLFSSGAVVACSGARIIDITDDSDSYTGQTGDGVARLDRPAAFLQLAAQNHVPGYIAQASFIDSDRPAVTTVMVSGNDVGFADVMAACVISTSLSGDCYRHYEDQLELVQAIRRRQPGLTAAYRQLYRPGGRVYAIGYPYIVAEAGSCGGNVHLSSGEIRFVRMLTDQLNAVIKLAAAHAGIGYVDVSQALQGHQLCQAAGGLLAVNGLTVGSDVGVGRLRFIGNESFHPTAYGHELLAQAIRRQTAGLSQPMPAKPSQPAVEQPPGPDSALPRTGQPLSTVAFDPTLGSGTFVRGQPVTITNEYVLKPGSAYSVSIGDRMVASGTTVSGGSVTAVVRIPADLPSGIQTLHLTGINQLNQPIDITNLQYIAASQADADGDGLADAVDPCPLLADVCTAPTAISPSTTQGSRAYLLDNQITIHKHE